MVQSKYNCTQAELYTIVQQGWNSCLAQLAAFTAFSAAYVTGLITARLAALTAAQALPDFQARNSIAEALRTDLQAQNDVVLNLFQSLKRYISYAFPAVQHQAQWDAAGWGYYASAAALNWDDTANMLVSMDNFITANSVALLLNSNMPTAFGATVASAKTDFDTLHADFLDARQAAYVATEDKVNANNAIYDDLIAMFADARCLGFSEALMKQFTFSSILTLISGTGVATLKGVITDDVTGLPIDGASVTLQNLAMTVTTTTTGEYQFTSIAGGTYDVEVDKVGYVQILDTVTVVSGSTTTKDYAMTV